MVTAPNFSSVSIASFPNCKACEVDKPNVEKSAVCPAFSTNLQWDSIGSSKFNSLNSSNTVRCGLVKEGMKPNKSIKHSKCSSISRPPRAL
ncbi:hypothetical protein D3C77_369950 [compost metagenome]